MTDYRAYYVDAEGHITGFEPIQCDADEQAIEAAKQFIDGRVVELWTGARLVIRLPKRAEQ